MICAVIVAGGSGSRMRVPVRKQYLPLDGIPIIGHTLTAFDHCPELERIVLVLPQDDLECCREKILNPLAMAHDVCLVAGGRRRQESVINGITALGRGDATVMIHDGVRPFVHRSLIAACLAGVKATGACIPTLPATDTLKQVDADGTILGTLDRRQIQLAQTPQTFSLDLIREAHRLAKRDRFAATDDASVAEFAGATVKVVPGDRDNIKITTPSDLLVARAILARWRNESDS